MRYAKLPALLVCCLFGLPAQAALFTLYDDSLGSLPANQSELFFTSDGTPSQTSNANGVLLTTDHAVKAGYSNNPLDPTFPNLDPATGFTLSFELQLNSENHNNNNRAGFSVILLDNSAQGVEIGFWEHTVWAQAVGFTHAEEASVDTASAEVSYDLNIFNGGYSLWGDGNLLLDGGLRSYLSPTVPYSVPNLLFLGDDTSSAAATIQLGMVLLETDAGPLGATVALPSSFALLLFGVLAWRRKPLQQ